jgi:hypothetical protein
MTGASEYFQLLGKDAKSNRFTALENVPKAGSEPRSTGIRGRRSRITDKLRRALSLQICPKGLRR